MPAALVLRPDGIVARGGDGAVPATVRHVTYAGQAYAVEAEAQGVSVRFAADAPPGIGATVALSVLGDRAFVTAVA